MEKDNAMNALLSWINKTDYKSKVESILVKHWEIFSRIPASKTGKYHPMVSNYEPFGLINHTLRCLWFARWMCEQEGLTQEEMEKIYTAIVIHDIGKVFYHTNSHGNIDHSDKSAVIAREAGLPEDIVLMVLHHMSHWDGYHPSTVSERIVAYADYLSSRKEIDIKGMKTFNTEFYSCPKCGKVYVPIFNGFPEPRECNCGYVFPKEQEKKEV